MKPDIKTFLELNHIREDTPVTGKACANLIEKYVQQFTLVTDEEILIYFNNHSNCRADMPVKIGDNPKIPAMTRSAVIEFAKWLRSRINTPVSDEEIEKIINDEPELPGTMPDEIWLATQDKDSLTELLRITVRKTKEGILNRLRSRMSIEQKCHKIYEAVKESQTPDKRTFEEAEAESKEAKSKKPDGAEEVIRRHFHGFSDEQWEYLKNEFPYCEIPYILNDFARQSLREELIKYDKWYFINTKEGYQFPEERVDKFLSGR